MSNCFLLYFGRLGPEQDYWQNDFAQLDAFNVVSVPATNAPQKVAPATPAGTASVHSPDGMASIRLDGDPNAVADLTAKL